MTSRRLVLLVRHLPDDTATKRAMASDPWPFWIHLLVSVINEQRVARADYAAAHGQRVTPQLIPRPGELEPAEAREQSRNMHDALLSMVAATPENDDARARLQRDVPQPPVVEIDTAGG